MKPLRFHPSVQQDIDAAIRHYGSISDALANDFWRELSIALEKIQVNPERHHFDVSNLRRCNLKRFPYNILYLVKPDRIRVQVVRHNLRNPSCGVRRRRT